MLWAAAAVVGLCGGSYLGVIADRVPAGLPTATGRSRCDSCDRALSWFELIPVVSWVALRGRCRTCDGVVPAYYPILEVLTAVLFGAMAWRFGLSWELGGYLVLVGALVSLGLIDLRTHRLPRRIIYVAAALGIPFLVAGALVAGEPERLWRAAIGGAAALAFFLLLYLITRGGMGDGDVRLAGLLGIFLGWISLLHVPAGLFFGFVAGAIVAIGMLGSGAGRKAVMPFGPYMATGAAFIIIVGEPLIDLWLPR